MFVSLLVAVSTADAMAPQGPPASRGPVDAVAVAVAPPGPVAEGEALFTHVWTEGDALSPAGDGLGPLYNATGCAGCHASGGVGGAGAAASNVVLLGDRGVIHAYGRSPGYEAWRKAQFEPSEIPEFGCGTAFVRFMAQFQAHPRNTPALFGAGALDQVSEAELEAAVRDGEARGVSGRIARDDAGRVGRFGWKAQTATLTDFVNAACAGELGLATPTVAQPADPLLPESHADRAAAAPPPLDLDARQVDALTAFVAALPSPPAADPSTDAGRARFDAVGCTACHQARLGAVSGAYTDLLLHDLGPTLSDGAFYGGAPQTASAAEPMEWRTPPLWGVASSAPYLHDGRADTVEAAIALHAGEASPSRDAYDQLPDGERAELLAFLASLRAP